MPRRGGGMRSPSPSAAPRRPFTTAPARTAPPPPAPVPAAAQPRQPGLFANMASTAAGVAVGSAVGHTIGAAMSGGGGGHTVEAAPVQQYQEPQQQQGGACAQELQQFLNCAQNQTDMNLCYGFNEALKQCKQNYGLQ